MHIIWYTAVAPIIRMTIPCIRCICFLLFFVSLSSIYASINEQLHFSLKNHFSANTLAMSPLLFDELDSYISRHNVLNIKNDSNICQRKFVIATYACPQAIGNHMHEFLNAVIGGFIMDRTILWRYCTRKACALDNQQDCDDHVTRSSWLPSLYDAEYAWRAHKCDEAHLQYGWPLIIQKFRWQSAKILMCCGIDLLGTVFLDFGTHDLHEMQVCNMCLYV